MRRTLVLMRHAQTPWNIEGRVQGHCDVPLDDAGRAQATRIAGVLARAHAVALWTSDLARARETAEIVAGACGLRVRLDKRLRETDVGERVGLTAAEYAARFPAEYASREAERPLLVPGEESAATVAERMAAVLRECLGTLADGQTGLVIAHGGCLREGIGELLGWQGGTARHRLMGMQNCSWARIDDHDGRLRLVSYNVGAAPDFPTPPPGR